MGGWRGFLVFADFENAFLMHDFIAKIYLFSEIEGGRKTPVRTGFRPIINFDGERQSYLTSSTWLKMDVEELFPGHFSVVEMCFASSEFFEGQLFESQKFTVQEGNFTIGRGEILELLNQKLRKAEKYEN